MSLPTATARLPRAPASGLDLAVLVAAIAAIVTTHVPMLDTELVDDCGCREWVRLSSIYGGAPALLIAALSVSRILTGHRGGLVRKLAHTSAVAGVMIVLLIVLFLDFEGPGYVANAVSHTALLALVILARPRSARPAPGAPWPR